ncbi:MAG: hypothetical protein O7D29_04370, partial [Gemmatimonadetes bacterium]|nr:hypothetical protein [Gemmatimonadota bacterium]
MTRESAPAFRKTDTAAILRKGQFFILDDYALREEMYEKVVTVFLDGIEKIESRDCRNKVATAGLSEIHRHFPVEKVRLLESFVLKRLRNDLYYWTYRVGLEQLGLERTFFVDHLILIRIHYPFLVARRAQNVLEPPYRFPEKLNLGIAVLKNWRLLFDLLDRVGRDSRDRRLS